MLYFKLLYLCFIIPDYIMKKLYFLSIILFLFCNSIYCQFSPTEAKWYYEYNQAPSYGYIKIEYIKDTIIENETCKVLQKIRNIYYYLGGIYLTDSLGNEYIFQRNDSVFNYKRGHFYLLYDFSAHSGDIWVVGAIRWNQYSSCDSIGQVKVDSVGLKIIYQDTLKVIYTSSYMNSNWVFSGPIVEKLGCLGYMLPEKYICLVDAGEGGAFRCYSDSLFLYHADSLMPCDYINTINKKINVLDIIKIFPNPTSEQINIEANFDNPFSYYIYNVLGHLEMTSISNTKLTTISTINLSNGIYNIVVNADGKTLRDRFIVLR